MSEREKVLIGAIIIIIREKEKKLIGGVLILLREREREREKVLLLER